MKRFKYTEIISFNKGIFPVKDKLFLYKRRKKQKKTNPNLLLSIRTILSKKNLLKNIEMKKKL